MLHTLTDKIVVTIGERLLVCTEEEASLIAKLATGLGEETAWGLINWQARHSDSFALDGADAINILSFYWQPVMDDEHDAIFDAHEKFIAASPLAELASR
jgi:hypothetical protein